MTQTQSDETERVYVITAVPDPKEGEGAGYIEWDCDYDALFQRTALVREHADVDRNTLAFYNVIFPATLLGDSSLADLIERMTLGGEDAHDGWEVTCNCTLKPKNAHLPAKDLIVVPDPDDPDEGHVECPHCGAVDSLIEQDKSVRWNTGEPYFENGKLTQMTWALGDGDYEHEKHLCGTCEGPITVPEDLDEDWS